MERDIQRIQCVFCSFRTHDQDVGSLVTNTERVLIEKYTPLRRMNGLERMQVEVDIRGIHRITLGDRRREGSIQVG